MLALSLCVLAGQAAQFQEIEQRLSPLAQKFEGVTFALATKETTGGWANVSFQPVRNLTSAGTFVDMFVREFSKYPQDFMRASKLKRVELVERLAVGQQFRSAVPDYVNEVLYYDVTYVTNLPYIRHVVHHELYHMLEQEWNGDAYFKDPNWAMMNEKDFKYGTGGADAYGRGDVWSFVHPKPGFVNVYSMYGLEEDKAEVWAVMFVPENWKKVAAFLEGDSILRSKVAYMRAFGRSKSPSMDAKFWETVTKD